MLLCHIMKMTDHKGVDAADDNLNHSEVGALLVGKANH